MQRIGRQRLARCCLRNTAKGAGTKKIDDDRTANNNEGCDRRLDGVRLRADQPLRGFPDHRGAKHEQQCRFGKRGHALDFAVAKLVLGIGRLAGKMRTAK